MSRQKIHLYGDADLESELEDRLRGHAWVNYVGAKELGYGRRDDDFHFREAARRQRVLVSHDDDYLDNSDFPLQQTNGVLVIKRGQGFEGVALALEKFLRWVWGPLFRDEGGGPTFGPVKVSLSNDGFHWWARTGSGTMDDEYYPFD